MMTKNNVSRVPVFISLVCSTMLFGGLSYLIYYDFETRVLNTQVKSINSLFDFAIENEIEDKKNALVLMSEYMSSEFPNASTWPYVSVPKKTFTKITDPLIEMAKLRTIGLLPIVETHEVEKFENFMEDFYIEQGYDSDLGVSDFGFGMYSKNVSSGLRYHTKNAENTAEGIYDILLPIIQTGNLEQNTAAVMYNIYAEYHRATAVDYILECNLAESVDCVSVSNFIHIVQDGVYRPAALVLYPIMSFNDQSGKNETVGAIHGVINWDDVIEGSAPDFAKGIEISITSDYEGETAYFRYEAPGTTYKAQTISKGRKPFHSIEVDLKHTKYTINLSLTDAYEASNRTSGPLIACAIAVTITLFTALIFLLYDRSINHDMLQKEMDVETKRLFVRYISHEIRTPLNTVHLGLQVLHDEMKCFIESGILDHLKSGNSGTNDAPGQYKPVMEEWTNFITNIDDSAEDAIAVLSDLLDFDKVSTGMLNIERDIHDISTLLADTVKPFSVNARSKNIHLSYTTLSPVNDTTDLSDSGEDEGNDKDEIGSDQVTKLSSSIVMFGDDIKIQQVMRNLVSNALKFTPEGGHVDITACWDKGGTVSNTRELYIIPDEYTSAGLITVRVKDSGAGMTPEQLGLLFREGVQFDANKLQAGQGSGLGLWISKEVVTQHRGSLTAESMGKGHGSVFILKLPVYFPPIQLKRSSPRWALPSPSLGSNKVATSSPRWALPSPSLGSNKVATSNYFDAFPTSLSPSSVNVSALSTSIDSIPTSTQKEAGTARATSVSVLIVDDSSSTRKVICRLLKNMGCVTLEAGDGQECLDMVADSKTPFDIILMDYEMPVMNGPDATAKLRELGCKIPIIGVTGNAFKEDRLMFMDRGAVEVLVKPLNMSNLKTVLSSFSTAFEHQTVSKKNVSISPKKSVNFPIGSRAISGHTEGKPDSKQYNVLIVDDVSSTRKVICRLLKNMGCFTTLEAGDGQECLDMVADSKTPFDIILMDYEMPVMNGPDATAKLRELGCKIPIIGVTGNVLKADTDYFTSMGALEVLHKPLNILKVKLLLSRWLSDYTPDSPTVSRNKYITSVDKNMAGCNVQTEPGDSGRDSSTLEKSVEKKHDDSDWCMMALNL